MASSRTIVPFTAKEVEEMRALEIEDETNRKEKELKDRKARTQMLAYPLNSSRTIAEFETAHTLRINNQPIGHDDGVITTILDESKKTNVYEVVPYFSTNILPMLIVAYLLWSLLYFGYRAALTINKANPYTIAFSAAFLFVELISFFATIVHYNNFTSITTNVLKMTLPEVLHKQKQDYPRVNVYVCCYKEPVKIVNRTVSLAMEMNYPPDRLNVSICDDSFNFDENRGREHAKQMHKAFLVGLLKRSVAKVFSTDYVGVTGEYEDRSGLLKDFTDSVSKTTKEGMEREVEWFVQYFLDNPFPDELESGIIDGPQMRELIQQLRADNFHPYRTFTEDELEAFESCSLETLRVVYDGDSFLQLVILCALFRRPHMFQLVERLQRAKKLRFVSPQALALARYQVLMLGRVEVDDPVVSVGNVRLDFVSTGEIECPSATYIRRRKPKIPHNKAGNINNALFNESNEMDFEFVVLLDADQKPHAEFLQRTLPYFYSANGKTIAWIQTPQFFSNIFPIDDPLGHRNMEFYGPVMEGRGSEGCCPFVGTNAIFRRSALCEIGGIMYNSVTEDMYTGMKLHVAGYKSLYHNEVLCIGTAPVDIKETLEQRKRWAQGAVEIFSLTPWAYLYKKLGMRKTVYNLDSCIYPFLAPTAFFYALAPVLITFWTVPIIVENPLLFLFIGGIPTMILPRLIQYIILSAKRPHEEGQAGPSLWVSATDLWRGEQTFFGFAATNLSAWHYGRKAISKLIKKYNVRGNLGMWNWNREFLPKKGAPRAPEDQSKSTEQTFRTSNKDVQVLKSSRLFVPNILMFALCAIACIHAVINFNCNNYQAAWLLPVVIGFAASTMWHLWSFIPMALRTDEKEWPYTSSYHGHNILMAIVAGVLVFLYSKVQLCIPTGDIPIYAGIHLQS